MNNLDLSHFEMKQMCSSNFLITQLPDDWYNFTEQQQDDFLYAHVWQPLEHLSAQEIWQLIESSADTFSDFLSSKGFAPENLC